MAEVRFLDEAEADLWQIGGYIASQSGSLEISLGFIKKIRERCALHATQPEMGTLRTDLGENVRCFTVENYVVIFHPILNGIEVLMVIHGSRDIQTHFQDRLE